MPCEIFAKKYQKDFYISEYSRIFAIDKDIKLKERSSGLTHLKSTNFHKPSALTNARFPYRSVGLFYSG